MSDSRIERPGLDNPADAPLDGVRLNTFCIRTDFVENPDGECDSFIQQDKSECRILASVELSNLSIRDMQSMVMLTVPLQDAMEVLAAAMDAAKEEKLCTEKISDGAEAVENRSCSSE